MIMSQNKIQSRSLSSVDSMLNVIKVIGVFFPSVFSAQNISKFINSELQKA